MMLVGYNCVVYISEKAIPVTSWNEPSILYDFDAWWKIALAKAMQDKPRT